VLFERLSAVLSRIHGVFPFFVGTASDFLQRWPTI